VVYGISRKTQTCGIVGGLGPETSCKFCLDLNKRFKAITNNQPCLVLENLSVSSEMENSLVIGEPTSEALDLLIGSVKRLNSADVDFIAIPCNTVHIFIEQLRQLSAVPIISIIEETALECGKRNLANVALLATSTTIEAGLHQKELSKQGISAVLPDDEAQRRINEIILRIIGDTADESDKRFLLRIVEGLCLRGAEALILGCTDLQSLIKETDSAVPLIDTLSVLENSALDMLLENRRGDTQQGRMEAIEDDTDFE
jgi:aspartate racemase